MGRRRFALAFALLLGLSSELAAQVPSCNDTTVRLCDTICEGTDYQFGGRRLTYSGTYYDTLSRQDGGCDSIVILALAVLPPPLVQFHVQNVCRGDTGYKILLGSDGNWFRWHAVPPDSSLAALSRVNPALRSVLVNPRVPTAYYVYADYGSQQRCPDSGSVSVTPLAPVTAAIHVSPAEVSIDQLELTLTDQSKGNREPEWGYCGREWYVAGEQIARWGAEERIRIALPATDSLRVKVTAYSYTCSDSAVAVLPVRRHAVYFPNVFRPGAGEEGLSSQCARFAPMTTGVSECEIWIYDRRGQLVHHAADARQGWDGCCFGAVCPQGTYVYRCRYRETAHPSSDQVAFGTVLLLR